MLVYLKLYKEYISGRTPLSLLDALMLILAILATIFYKIITRSTPPNITDLDFGLLLNGMVLDSEYRLAVNSFFGSIDIVAVNYLSYNVLQEIIVLEFD